MSYKPHLSRLFFIVVDLILQATEPKVKLDLVLITTVSWNSSTTTFLYVFSYGLSKQGMYKTNPSLQFCAKILRNTQSKFNIYWVFVGDGKYWIAGVWYSVTCPFGRPVIYEVIQFTVCACKWCPLLYYGSQVVW